MTVMIQIKNLFDADNNDDCYKPISVKSSFKKNYKYYESKGDKQKKLSVMQYLYKITAYLHDITNDQKTNSNNSNEWKIIKIMRISPFQTCFIFIKRGNSYIKSLEWIVNKRATINVKNKDDNCFEYFIIVALHHQGFDNHPER